VFHSTETLIETRCSADDAMLRMEPYSVYVDLFVMLSGEQCRAIGPGNGPPMATILLLLGFLLLLDF